MGSRQPRCITNLIGTDCHLISWPLPRNKKVRSGRCNRQLYSWVICPGNGHGQYLLD